MIKRGSFLKDLLVKTIIKVFTGEELLCSLSKILFSSLNIRIFQVLTLNDKQLFSKTAVLLVQ